MRFIFVLTYVVVLTGFASGAKLEISSNGNVVESILHLKVRDFLQLTCKLTDYESGNRYDHITLKWNGPQNPQNSQNRIKPFLSIKESTLNISSLHSVDNGQYTCFCPELNLSTSFWLHVKVHKKPFCGDTMFVCWKFGNCIPRPYVCDGKVDCKYGEDESIEECGADPCEGKIHNCRDGRCIPTSWCCDSELDNNCTVKEKPSCCRQQFKFPQEQTPGLSDVHGFKESIFKATLFSLFIGAVLFFFLISICLLVLCRIHIHSCPANQDIREVCARTRIPFYDFYLYLNRNWNNLDHSRALCRSPSRSYFSSSRTSRFSPIGRIQNTLQVDTDSDGSVTNNNRYVNNTLPHSILLMSYFNNEIQYVHRPVNPPPYSEVVNNTTRSEPPPPYVSRENLVATQSVDNDNDEEGNVTVRRGYILVTTEGDDNCNSNSNVDNINNNIVNSTSCANEILESEVVCSNNVEQTNDEIGDEQPKALDSSSLNNNNNNNVETNANNLQVVNKAQNSSASKVKKQKLEKKSNDSTDGFVTATSSFASSDSRQNSFTTGISFESDSSKNNERRKKFDLKKLRHDFFGGFTSGDTSNAANVNNRDIVYDSDASCTEYDSLINSNKNYLQKEDFSDSEKGGKYMTDSLPVGAVYTISNNTSPSTSTDITHFDRSDRFTNVNNNITPCRLSYPFCVSQNESDETQTNSSKNCSNTNIRSFDSDSSIKLRETYVESPSNFDRLGLPECCSNKSQKLSIRPKSLNCDTRCLATRSQNSLDEYVLQPIPLVKCNSGNLFSYPENLPSTDLDVKSKHNFKDSFTRHSIADLSPSGSNEYRCFDMTNYDRDLHTLTLPLRESFIGLRKDE